MAFWTSTTKVGGQEQGLVWIEWNEPLHMHPQGMARKEGVMTSSTAILPLLRA